jgi:hypothetical protein
MFEATASTPLLAIELAPQATGDVSPLETLLASQIGHDRTHAAQIEGILERYAILSRLAAIPRQVRQRVEALALAEPSGAPGPGAATVVEELGRWRDFEQRMLTRYVLILEQAHPSLRPFDADPLDPWRGEPTATALLREFEALRASTLELLRALGPRLWQRRGAHPRRGDLSIAELIAQHTDHDTERLAALRALPLPRIRLEAATSPGSPLRSPS